MQSREKPKQVPEEKGETIASEQSSQSDAFSDSGEELDPTKPERNSVNDSQVGEASGVKRSKGDGKREPKEQQEAKKKNSVAIKAPIVAPGNTFWKIPMPTRKNTKAKLVESPNGGSSRRGSAGRGSNSKEALQLGPAMKS